MGKNHPWKKKEWRYKDRMEFSDITTCPICTQLLTDKPFEEYGVREIMHIRKHLRRVFSGDED